MRDACELNVEKYEYRKKEKLKMATNAKRCSYSTQASQHKTFKGKNSTKFVGGRDYFGILFFNCAESFDWVKIGEKNGRISGNQW